jgi:hypothetical protein
MADGDRRTTQATGVLSLIKPRKDLEVQLNIFSVNVVDSWNVIPERIIKDGQCPEGWQSLYYEELTLGIKYLGTYRSKNNVFISS